MSARVWSPGLVVQSGVTVRVYSQSYWLEEFVVDTVRV